MKISILTPTENSEKYMLETLESIHNQKYPELEHIIVDVGEDDIVRFDDKYGRQVLKNNV